MSVSKNLWLHPFSSTPLTGFQCFQWLFCAFSLSVLSYRVHPSMGYLDWGRRCDQRWEMVQSCPGGNRWSLWCIKYVWKIILLLENLLLPWRGKQDLPTFRPACDGCDLLIIRVAGWFQAKQKQLPTSLNVVGSMSHSFSPQGFGWKGGWVFTIGFPQADVIQPGSVNYELPFEDDDYEYEEIRTHGVVAKGWSCNQIMLMLVVLYLIDFLILHMQKLIQ